MAKYFVHEGLQLETIAVSGSHFGGTSTSPNVDAVTLESVVTALGIGIVADLAALKAFWATTSGIDQFLLLARELLEENAKLFPSPLNGDPDGPDSALSRDFHQQSNQYVLPIGFSDAIAVLPDSNSDAARNRLIVKALEFDHTNIKKHATTEDAREAWVAYTIAADSDHERTLAQKGYLINPPSSN